MRKGDSKTKESEETGKERGKEGRAVMGHPQEGSQRSAFVTSEKQAEVEKREREKRREKERLRKFTLYFHC